MCKPNEGESVGKQSGPPLDLDEIEIVKVLSI